MKKQNRIVMSAAALTLSLLVTGRATAGSLNPTSAPGPTMHTLEEIYQKVQSLDPNTQQTLSATTTAVSAGYYAATNLTQVDVDLAPPNITTGTTIFGVAGSAITANGTATAPQVLEGSTFSTTGASGLTGTMADRGAVAIAPGTAPQTIPQGYHNGFGSVTGDANLVTANIKSGVTIFGVAGKSSVVDTASGTAAPGDILPGKTAYVNGALVSGTLASQTLSPATTTVNAGYYATTNLTAVDTDLAAENIKTGVTIFGVSGTLSTNAGGDTYSAAVPKTGQTNSYAAYDDGAYQKGVALPTPRFTVGASGDATNCVTDNLTGLMWARNANMGGAMSWSNAIVYCETLNYGGQTDWRLPNIRELHSLVDFSRYNPALCNTVGTGPWTAGNPFSGVQDFYWSGTVVMQYPVSAWGVAMSNGLVTYNTRIGNPYYVWPVRGGQ